jgi:putative endonuclease
MSKFTIGQKGELLAKKFLSDKGLKIIKENYRHKKGQVDLIAEDDQTIIFVEVKYRKNNSFGYPEDFVSENQKRLIHLCAENFLLEFPFKKNIRFDIIAILDNKIEHFEDAF